MRGCFSRLLRLTTALRHASGQSRTCNESLPRRGSGAASFGPLVEPCLQILLEDLDHLLQQVCSHVPGEGSDIHRTSSYLGVTPVALTNADATAMRPLRAPLSQALAWLGPHPPPATYLQHLLLAASQKLPKHLSRSAVKKSPNISLLSKKNVLAQHSLPSWLLPGLA
ncbi:hypothetical protein WJX77_011352 [Trebouxia sp. C0004]